MTQLPRVSHPDKEGTLCVSKWLKSQLLIEVAEMRALLELLNPLIFNTCQIVSESSAIVTQDDFLKVYAQYIDALKSAKLPDEALVRTTFSSIFTKEKDLLYAMELSADRYLIKPVKPVIQLQMHQFFPSKIDHTIHPMVLGKESIFWGIQISYPQIYQDPLTKDFFKVTDSPEFPNTALFTQSLRWLRRATLPTPFVYEGKKINSSIRLGKECLSWINRHPQLQQHDILICAPK